MKPRETTPVRALARRYAAGEIAHRDYIRERRTLIDDIAEGRIPLPDEDIPPPPPVRRALSEALAADDTVEFTLPGKSPLPWLVLGLVLAVGGLAAWFLLAR